MIIVQKETTPIADECILLGRQMENEARQIQFDLSWLIGEYGSGTATLVHQRNKDTAPYICTATQTGNTLTWTLDNQDTAYDGWGQAELRWTVNDVLAKTLVYKTMTVRSITADSTIPDPYESWYDQMIEYIDEHGGSGAVASVNGKTGVVILNASDVHALPDSTTIPTKVSQLQNDSGFGTYSKPSGGIPKTDLASGVQASLDKADSALQTAPVTSVNNKTGAVTLSASDVGAGTYSKPSGGIPSSDMTSAVQTSLGKADSAYQKPSGGIPSTDMSSAVQTSLGKADTALQTAPVSSVNTKTGAVTLAAGDIGYDDSETYASGSVGAKLSSLSADLTDTQTDIGDLSNLETTAKSNLVAAINEAAQSGGGGTSDYSDLTNKPSINSVTLSGNKSLSDLGVASATDVSAINTGTSDDIGKALSPKTVSNGKITEWQFKSISGGGGGGTSDYTDLDNKPQINSVTLNGNLSLSDIGAASDDIVEVKHSINLYDRTSCSPADGYMYSSHGAYTQSSYYACTGKIPVDASTQYIFSAGDALVFAVRYFSGSSGGTFISGETINGAAFTTPATCTFIAINLFGEAHTTTQYDAAIAKAQLEKGSIVHPYEPYGDTMYVPLDAIEDGDKLSGISEATVIQSPINLYDKTLAENGKAYSNGVPSTGAAYAISGLVAVEPNTQYCISIDPTAPMDISGVVYEYDADRTYTGKIITGLGGYIYRYLLAFCTGATTRFISVNLYKDSHTTQDFNDTIDTLMVCYGTQRPQTYSAYNEQTSVLASHLSNAYFENFDCFKGKKWLAMGTSLTWYDSKAYQEGLNTGEICRGYVGNVARRKSLIVNNDGLSGGTLGNKNSDSLINRYQNLDWANSDIATIEFGINDFGNNIPVGTASDAAGNSTFAACYKTIIEYAFAQNPKICLVLCTEPDVRGTSLNNNGNTLKDYTDVTLEIAELYRLPVCDWYYKSGINATTRGSTSVDYLTADGTHPNDDGHMRMGAMLNHVFDSLFC